MEQIAIDIGYGYVKAVSGLGKRILFPSLVGKGYERTLGNVFGNDRNTLEQLHVELEGQDYFVGELAKESRSPSRVFERERFSHLYTRVLLTVAKQLVTGKETNRVRLATGLPLDFYQSQAQEFKESILGDPIELRWRTKGMAAKKIIVEEALVLPQGASAIFSALINEKGSFFYPQLMKPGTLLALIDIGFRTTDFIVIEMKSNGSFAPILRLSGTFDEGVVNLHRDIKETFKTRTGGADLNEYHLSRIIETGDIHYKGKSMNFAEEMDASIRSIVTNIADRLKASWGSESDLFDAIFVAGGGGTLFTEKLQSYFDHRLIVIDDAQFANANGYLWLLQLMNQR